MAPLTAERDVLETIGRERDTAQTYPAVVLGTFPTEFYCSIRVNVYSRLSFVVIRGEYERARRPTSFRERTNHMVVPRPPVSCSYESAQGDQTIRARVLGRSPVAGRTAVVRPIRTQW